LEERKKFKFWIKWLGLQKFIIKLETNYDSHTIII
jgi:hypothetical protein